MKWTAKPVGYHNELVFGGLLGLSAQELDELTRKKVIGKWADARGARPPLPEPEGAPGGTAEGEGRR
jgi:hypothetical protein